MPGRPDERMDMIALEDAPPRRRKTRLDPQGVRQRILDSAEMLFADRGYAATPLRDVAQIASVPVSLITHHFGTKEELFREVISRRIHDHVGSMREQLAQLQRDAAGAPIGIEPFIRAYIGPMITRSVEGGPGWKNYARLLGRAMNSRQYEEFLRPMIEVYDPVNGDFTKELQRIYPKADERRLYWAMYFVQSTILHVLVEAGMVDRQSGGVCRSSELEAILDEMVPFFAAAFAARLAG